MGQAGHRCLSIAFWANGQHYADTALQIVSSWARSNRRFGLQSENGPLQAAWGAASLAKALELLRGSGNSSAWEDTRRVFNAWVADLLLPQMEAFAVGKTAEKIAAGERHVHSNWHSSIAEAWMALAALNDDVQLYEKAVGLFHVTVRDYLKFGRPGGGFSDGRVLGECSETWRDLFHSEFGLGGLLQTAEMAWQLRGDDLYSSNDYALAAALELHARIVNAWDMRNEAMLPAGYRFAELSMPAPPRGCSCLDMLGHQLAFELDCNFETQEPAGAFACMHDPDTAAAG